MPKTTTRYFLQKVEGKRFRNDSPDTFADFESQAPAGCYIVEIKRERPPKTQKQCAVIFALMIKETIRQAEEKSIGVEELMRYLLTRHIPKGVAITSDYLHALMYIICPTFNEKGKEVTLSKMNTIEASELFERFRNIMAPLGIVIDDPNPDWQKKQQVE